MNEELQFTNKLLNTSQRKMERVTIELQARIDDLARAKRNDTDNFFAGTGVGTLFLDMELRILRFTPTLRDGDGHYALQHEQIMSELPHSISGEHHKKLYGCCSLQGSMFQNDSLT